MQSDYLYQEADSRLDVTWHPPRGPDALTAVSAAVEAALFTTLRVAFCAVLSAAWRQRAAGAPVAEAA